MNLNQVIFSLCFSEDQRGYGSILYLVNLMLSNVNVSNSESGQVNFSCDISKGHNLIISSLEF